MSDSRKGRRHFLDERGRGRKVKWKDEEDRWDWKKAIEKVESSLPFDTGWDKQIKQ